MFHLFLINPNAGPAGAARRAEETIRAACLAAGAEFRAVVTQSPEQAQELTRRCGEAGRPVRLYVVGGDGTLNRVVQAAAGRPHLAVTNLPAGTGNDFLKLFGPDYRRLFWDLPALMDGPQAPFDLIDCGGVLALDIACAGVDARVARDVHRYPAAWGKGAYLLSLFRNAVLRGIARPMTVTVEDRRWSGPVSLVCVCNGRYYGGGFMPVGEAMPDDRVLDALVVPGVGRLTFARLVGDYAKGRYARHPDRIFPYHGPGPITLEADQPFPLCLDGEILERRRVTLSLSEKRVNFFWPPGADYRPTPAGTGK